MGESKKAFAADGDTICRTHIGGQALIEGVMMRGKYNWAVAVREPNGSIYTEEHELASGRKKNSWLRWPIIRGCTAFVESLALGYKALSISADHAIDFEEGDGPEEVSRDSVEPIASQKEQIKQSEQTESSKQETKAKSVVQTEQMQSISETLQQDKVVNAGLEEQTADKEQKESVATVGQETSMATDEQKNSANIEGEEDKSHINDHKKTETAGMGVLMIISLIIGLVIGVALFIILPAFLSNLIFGQENMNTIQWNIFDGLVRVAIFILYIWLVSRMKDIKRMFSYHGAEHRTIHCFEHGKELKVENARHYPNLHVRCGTAFLIMVMLIAIFIYTVLAQPINALIDMTGVYEGPLRFVLVVLTRIILMPLIAGLSYEVTVKWAGKRPNNPFVRIILWPGMQMQKLTTNAPDDSMLECAIVAMKMVLAYEKTREESENTQKRSAA